HQVLGQCVALGVWDNLQSQAIGNIVSLADLSEAGLDISFDTSTLSLSAAISPAALGSSGMDFGTEYQSFVPTTSGRFSWFNSFNLSHTQNWQNDDNSQTSSLEWLAQFNVGGTDGVNLLMANYLDIDDEQTNFQRGEWQLYYDNPYAPYRLSLGDVEALGAGHLSGANIGGISLSSDYAALQPSRVIGPNSNQALVLTESADIEIWVNGQMIFNGRQPAGRLSLANMPMTNGANDIEVRVRYLSGKTETFVFTKFYNTNLLNEGMINYGAFLGSPSSFGEDGVEYTDSWLSSGFVEYGVNSWLTLGGNGAMASYGQVVGATAIVGSPWGNFSTRLSFSNHDRIGTGNSVSFNFESSVIGASNEAAPNLRLSAEFADDFFSTPWEQEASSISFNRYLASYTWTINSSWYLSLTGSYYSDSLNEQQISATSLLNWRSGNLTIGPGLTMSQVPMCLRMILNTL
ncbi:MAG: fimbria/pilus outer membrane usher protein, partial [Shewanella sp.]|nr:fimbria/pilus outer membrane usher protein [Shewanella sp.]